MSAVILSAPFPSLDGLPYDIISQIASETFPPASTRPTHRHLSSIASLSLTCKSVYSAISMNNNPGIYALIFHHLFDTAAIRRRLGDSGLCSRAAAACLKHRFIMLKQIKSTISHRGIAGSSGLIKRPISCTSIDKYQRYTEILRGCLLMLIENDIKNFNHLNGVGIRDFIYHVLRRVSNIACSTKATVCATLLSLCLAVLYMSDSQEDMVQEDDHRRTEILDFLLRFVHPSSWRWNEASLNGYMASSELPPLLFEYLGVKLSLTLPSISMFARLCTTHRYTAAVESSHDRSGPFRGQQTPSILYDRFWSQQIFLIDNSSYQCCAIINKHVGCLKASESHFHGHFFVPYPIERPPYILTCSQVMTLTLREYHCYSTDPIPFKDDNEESLARAWFPEGVSFQETRSSLRIYDPVSRRYVTYGVCKGQEQTDISGIKDTVMIGKTDPNGEAFGEFEYYGRMRPSDGNVALVRKPIDPQRDDLGTWIFYGSLYQGLHFVGDWRVISTTEYAPGRQGWMHLSRNVSSM